ncbi:hypothetical protein, partial [Glutamicibacter arilaitensis]
MADEQEITEHLKTIADLNEPGQALANDSPHISVRNPQWFHELAPGKWEAIGQREQLHRKLISQQLR